MLPAARDRRRARRRRRAARAGSSPATACSRSTASAVRYWEDIEHVVQHSHRQGAAPADFAQRQDVRALPDADRRGRVPQGRDGKVTHQGRVGIKHAPFVPLVGVIDAQSPAGRAGPAHAGSDHRVDGQPVRNWSDVVSASLGKVARRSSIVYFRGTEMPGVPQVQLLSRGLRRSRARYADRRRRGERQTYTGLEHAEMFVAHVDPGSPADGAGLKPGDLITALDDKPVTHWVDLDQRLQAEPTQAFKVTWKRAAAGGKTETLIGRGHAGVAQAARRVRPHGHAPRVRRAQRHRSRHRRDGRRSRAASATR